MTWQSSLHMTWHIWVLVTRSPTPDRAMSGCGRADHDLYWDLSQALAGQVRDRLGSMETELFRACQSDQ